MSRLPSVNHPQDQAQPSGAGLSRRVDTRISVRGSIVLVMADGSTRPGATQDVSLRGASLTTDRPITPGSKCQLVVERSSAEGLQTLGIAAKTVYSSYAAPKVFRIGLVFTGGEASAKAIIQELMAGSLPSL
jgi:hypothetical protein